MNVLRRLKRLDEQVDGGLRQAGEPAEAYLRRAASFIRLRNNDVGHALREHFADLDRERGDRR